MSQESKIDSAVIKKTQDTLGRLIQAPSLTDKLLNRPPVQFIQDIVKSVIKNTGFMKGLYSQEELEAAFIKSSKENKILFLNKLIIAVGIAVGEQLSAKANKIAAGVEAEKTNELFQALAKAINMRPDNDEIVKKTLKKLKAMDGSDDKNEKEDKKEKSRDRDRTREEDKERTRGSKNEESGKSRDRERDREKDRERKERGDRDKDRERDREKDRERKDRDRGDKDKDREKDKERKERGDRDKDRDRHKEKERKERDHDRDREKDKESSRDKERHRDKDREKTRDRDREKESKREDKEPRKSEERPRHRRDSNDESQNHKAERGDEELSSRKNDDESEESTNRRRPSSARGPRVQIERDENYALRSQAETFEDNRNIARPTTARPGAPRPKLNNESNDTPVKVSSAAKKSTVIVHEDSDSDGDFVVKENKFQEEDNKNWKGLDDFKKPGDEEENEKHGALVTKILESKGKLEHGNELHKSTDQQKPTIQMDLQRKKERERTQKEIDKLKESIQTLTKASIPLGRTLDFLQEDIDMMQKEILKWSDEYDNNCRVLKRQQAEMANFIEPYREALRQIENQISEQMDRIGTVKRNILLNEEKTSRLIFNIGKS